jgi:hypothetical protein
MGLLDGPDPLPGEEPADKRSRWPALAGIGALLLLAGGAAWWMTRPSPAPPAEVPAETAVRPRERAPLPRSAEPAPAPETPSAPPREREVVEAQPEAPPAAAEPVRTLTVETDVTGAMVFVDRVFIGYSPVTTSEVKPGRHQLNVSAAGYDGVAQTIDVSESGATRVDVKLAEVRLNQVVDVVHKHGIGSCQGQLTADLSGFTYRPKTGNDGFSVSLDALEIFEVDYLGKNLRLKQRGGRTWNFESPTGSADPLFVFHRDVERVRGKLSGR